MKLVVILPALNEEQTIGSVLSHLPKTLPGISEIVPVVVDDGSSDRTADIARESGAVVCSHPVCRGVGAAFKTGKTYAIHNGADILVNMDSDGQFDPGDIARIVEPIVDKQADFVTASRFGDPDYTPVMPRLKLWGNSAMTRLVNMLARSSLTDVSCGLRAYSQEALLRLNLFGEFTYTQEVILSLALSSIVIKEVPVRVRGEREFGTSRVADSLLKYALQTSKIIFRTYRDYRPMRFFLGLSAVSAIPSLALSIFLGIYYSLTGRVSPHKWAAFMAGFFFLMSILAAMTGVLADMNTRIRSTIEEILINQRKSQLEARRSSKK